MALYGFSRPMICIYIHIRMYVYIYTYVCMHIYIYTYLYIYICTYVYSYIYTYVYTYFFTYIYIHIYIYTYIYIHTYIYIYIWDYHKPWVMELIKIKSLDGCMIWLLFYLGYRGVENKSYPCAPGTCHFSCSRVAPSRRSVASPLRSWFKRRALNTTHIGFFIWDCGNRVNLGSRKWFLLRISILWDEQRFPCNMSLKNL